MHAASVDPEPGSNSPKMHSLAAATSSEGLTARTSIIFWISATLQLSRCSPLRSTQGVRRRTRSMGPSMQAVKRARDRIATRLQDACAPSEDARLEEEDDRRAGEPRLQRELDGARRTERTG